MTMISYSFVEQTSQLPRMYLLRIPNRIACKYSYHLLINLKILKCRSMKCWGNLFSYCGSEQHFLTFPQMGTKNKVLCHYHALFLVWVWGMSPSSHDMVWCGMVEYAEPRIHFTPHDVFRSWLEFRLGRSSLRTPLRATLLRSPWDSNCPGLPLSFSFIVLTVVFFWIAICIFFPA